MSPITSKVNVSNFIPVTLKGLALLLAAWLLPLAALALSETTVYVGGSFSTTGGQSHNNLAAFDRTQPEIILLGNGQVIFNGDTSPALADHTDFGGVAISGGQITRTFTISNSGSGALTLSGTPPVSLTGPAASEFSLVLLPTTPVAGGGTTAFQIRFDPAATGLRQATLSIANNDGDENPYTFALQGTGSGSTVTPQAYLPLLVKNFAGPAKIWSRQAIGLTTNNLNGISCPSATTCFVAADQGIVYKTIDAGLNWSSKTTPLNHDLTGISCPSTTICFVVDDSGYIYKTTNGSGSWSEVYHSPRPLHSISCPDANNCMAVGGANANPPVVAVYFTTNGGSDWETTPSGIILGHNVMYGVDCPIPSQCVMAGQFGRIWAIVGSTAFESGELGGQLQGVHCPTTTACFAVGGAGKIYFSSNLRNGWSAQNSGVTNTLNGVNCPGASTCFAVGSGGTLLATTNGGGAWTVEKSPTSANLTGIDCPTSGICWAVGDAGTILVGQ